MHRQRALVSQVLCHSSTSPRSLLLLPAMLCLREESFGSGPFVERAKPLVRIRFESWGDFMKYPRNVFVPLVVGLTVSGMAAGARPAAAVTASPVQAFVT